MEQCINPVDTVVFNDKCLYICSTNKKWGNLIMLLLDDSKECFLDLRGGWCYQRAQIFSLFCGVFAQYRIAIYLIW